MEKVKLKNTRIIWVDIAKAIAIILMIIGHECSKKSIIAFIFSFHMPLFFMMSGYTSSPIISWNQLLKKTKRNFINSWLLAAIMITLLGFEIVLFQHKNILSVLQLDLKGIFWGSNYGIDHLNNVGVMWFLIVFFWAKFFYDFLQIIVPNNYNGLVLGILSYFAFVVSNNVWLPQALDIVPIASLFMWIGAYLREIQSKLNFNKYLISVVIIAIFIYWIAMIQNNVYIDMSVRHYPLFIFSILEAVAGTIIISFISNGISKNSSFNFLKTIGRNTLAILCIHHLDLYWLWWGRYFPKWYIAVLLRLIVDLGILFLILMVKNNTLGRKTEK
ncbi:acyltransferase family protein [Limosilactobacillus caccae]|uniref:acyltransferase family protein n=1 Tax=Limosilactobacillus caccae TaxID=1926284 RepID=UPI00097070CC|nr:acyltransferase family protein [Limosilactobacillus caccae]